MSTSLYILEVETDEMSRGNCSTTSCLVCGVARASAMLQPSCDCMDFMIKYFPDKYLVFGMIATFYSSSSRPANYDMFSKSKDTPMSVPPPPRTKHIAMDKIFPQSIEDLKLKGPTPHSARPPPQLRSRFSVDTIREEQVMRMVPTRVDKPLPPTPPSAVCSHFSTDTHDELLRKRALRKFPSVDLKQKFGMLNECITGPRQQKATPEYQDVRLCAEPYYIASNDVANKIGKDALLYDPNERTQAEAEVKAKAHQDAAAIQSKAREALETEMGWMAEGVLKPDPAIKHTLWPEQPPTTKKKKQVRWNNIPNAWHPPKDGPRVTPKSGEATPAPIDLAPPRTSSRDTTSSMQSEATTKLVDIPDDLEHTDTVEQVQRASILSRTASRIKAMSLFHWRDLGDTLVAILDQDIPAVEFDVITPTNDEHAQQGAEPHSASFVKNSDFARELKARVALALKEPSAKTRASAAADSNASADQQDEEEELLQSSDEIVIERSKMSYFARSEFARRVAAGVQPSGNWKRPTICELTDETKKAAKDTEDMSGSVFMDKFLADLGTPSQEASPKAHEQCPLSNAYEFAHSLKRVQTGSTLVSPPSSAAVSVIACTPPVVTPEQEEFEKERLRLFLALNLAREQKDVIKARTTEELEQARKEHRRLSEDIRMEKLKFDKDLDADAQIAANGQDLIAAAARAKMEYGHATAGQEKLAANLARRQLHTVQAVTFARTIEETGHVQITGPAGYGAIATGILWAEGGHHLHAKRKPGMRPPEDSKQPSNEDFCNCPTHAIWSVITDGSYRYVGIARSRLEKQWIVHLAQQKPSEEKVSRHEAARRVGKPLPMNDPTQLMAAEYRSECLDEVDEEDDDDDQEVYITLQTMVDHLRRQQSIPRKPLPCSSPSDSGDTFSRPTTGDSEGTFSSRRTCDSVAAGGICSKRISLAALEGGDFF